MHTILLQASNGGGGFNNFLFIGALILIFYLFFILPQQRKAKQQRKFREEMKKGDEVVTIGGLHGKIYDINDATVTLEVDKGIKLTFEKSAVLVEGSKRSASKTTT